MVIVSALLSAVADSAKAILRLPQDPELRTRTGQASRPRVEEHFDWDKKGLFMAKLYESLSATKEGVAVKHKLSA